MDFETTPQHSHKDGTVDYMYTDMLTNTGNAGGH